MRQTDDVYGDLDEAETRRLDLLLYRRFVPRADAEAARRLWRHFRRGGADLERFPDWSLSRLLGAASDRERDRRAIRNVVDYHYEPRFLQSLAEAQRYTHLESIHRHVGIVTEVDVSVGPWPVLVEYLHHRWVFPTIALLLAALKERGGLEKAILLRRFRERDCRLDTIFDYVEKRLGCATSDISFEDAWYRRLKGEVSGKTVVLYFGDMSPYLFPTPSPPHGSRRYLLLTNGAAPGRLLETYSIADKLAVRLGLRHLTLDLPGDSQLHLRTPAETVILRCPAEQWSFWPALELYPRHRYEVRRESAD